MSEKPTFACTVLACQIAVPETRTRSQLEQHADLLVEKLAAQLADRPADLVVLPELSTVEYSRESFEQLPQLAENLEGPCVRKFRQLAIESGATVVMGMPRTEEGRFYISQVVLDPAGEVVGCYDKLHICQYGASMEKEFYDRGHNLCVFEVNGLRFAPIICYDIRIPELSRTLVLRHDVDCILHCGAYFRDESFATWHAFAIARAMENQVYLLGLNRAGRDYGESIFCPPWMDEKHPATIFDARDEDFRYLDVETARIAQVRRDYTFLLDRLEDYSTLSKG